MKIFLAQYNRSKRNTYQVKEMQGHRREMIMEKYIIVEDKKGNLSIVSNQEYQKENVNRLKWDAISGSDEMEEAEKILAHIKEVGGVQNYFLELMDKLDFHTVKTPERTVVSIVEKLPDGFVRVQQLNNSLYKIMEEGTAEQEDAIMVTLGRDVKLRKCKNIEIVSNDL